MSELKKHHINEVMDMHNLTRGKMGYSFVYYADDVDKVIVEKDKVIAYAQALVLKDIEIIRRHKYKRCLAMAKYCEAMRGHYLSYEEPKWFWYRKWSERWLEIADKFKEAK